MKPLHDIRLAVFGPGLLGGSLLHDARAMGMKLHVWARRKKPLADVRKMGLADVAGTDPVAVAEGADLLVFCIPVGGMKALAEQLTAARPASGAVFTDVGSVKGIVMREVTPILGAAGHTFIGSHPMAGSEESGLRAARAGLYRDAACILTPPPEVRGTALKRLHAFWQSLGCRTSEMDAVRHDYVVAHISHLPHVAAVLAALTALRSDPGMARFGGGGFRDTTRVASGKPSLWCEILMENREALLPALREFRDSAIEVLEALESGNDSLLEARLEEARSLRSPRYP